MNTYASASACACVGMHPWTSGKTLALLEVELLTAVNYQVGARNSGDRAYNCGALSPTQWDSSNSKPSKQGQKSEVLVLEWCPQQRACWTCHMCVRTCVWKFSDMLAATSWEKSLITKPALLLTWSRIFQAPDWWDMHSCRLKTSVIGTLFV